jgi:hypothetical protein
VNAPDAARDGHKYASVLGWKQFCDRLFSDRQGDDRHGFNISLLRVPGVNGSSLSRRSATPRATGSDRVGEAPPRPSLRVKRGVSTALAIATLLSVGSILTACGKSTTYKPISPPTSGGLVVPPVHHPGDVTFTVTGDATDATITYEVAGSQQQHTGQVLAALPGVTVNGFHYPGTKAGWTQDEPAFSGDPLSISAQGDEKTTTITCTISQGGKTIDTASSSGPFSVCTASGAAP